MATETLLRAIGVHSKLIPPSVGERSALLRGTLAGREALMLLNNARRSDSISRVCIPRRIFSPFVPG